MKNESFTENENVNKVIKAVEKAGYKAEEIAA
jgi:hypothetical protein